MSQRRYANKPDGYRYVRESRVCSKCAKRFVHCRCGPQGEPMALPAMLSKWALYEVRDGRARRVGTARSEREYREFLQLDATGVTT